jgi:hypothetical protein
MTDLPASRALERGTLLLADISGFTGFLQGVADAHHAIIFEADEPPAAYSVLSSLLDTMLATLVPPFSLAKVEGDAVFVVAADPAAVRGLALVDLARTCNAAFATSLVQARRQWTCTCSACARIGGLGLKFVVHHGRYAIRRIGGRDELLGPDVNTVHRLLKNHARDVVGPRPYVLFTDASLEALEIPAEAMTAMTESYDDLPSVPVHVLALA